MEMLLRLLYCHLIGDYVLQSGYIAEMKVKPWYLLVHCILYTFPFYCFFSVNWQLFTIFALHLAVDFAKTRNKLNSVIDQAIHIATLLIYFL